MKLNIEVRRAVSNRMLFPVSFNFALLNQIRLVGVKPNFPWVRDRQRQRMARSVVELYPRVYHLTCVNFNSDRSKQVLLELVCVDEHSQILDGKYLTSLASYRNLIYLVDKLRLKGRIRNHDVEVWWVVGLLDNLGQRNDEMALGWLVESESVVDWGHQWADL